MQLLKQKAHKYIFLFQIDVLFSQYQQEFNNESIIIIQNLILFPVATMHNPRQKESEKCEGRAKQR